jgi:arylsulfatase A-like enzyme/Flp pilus assembly protein TadD
LAPLRRSPPRNLLLITIDTLRADRLGCYGYAAARTPNLDRLAAEGVRFDAAIAPAPITLPSHASLLTGRYPASHGVHSNGRERLPAEIPTLAEAAATRFPRRAAIVASVTLDRLFGLDRGFLEYDDRLPAEPDPSFLNRQERRAEEIAVLATRWLAGSQEPFLLWVHLFDPHAPYQPPSPWREEMSDPYDGEIAAADATVGRILAALEPSGAIDRTLVVVAGDHGEDLRDHGEPTHGVFLYDASIRVPLLFRYPSGLPAGRVVTAQVRLIDVMPTLLEISGLPIPPGVQGASLVPLLTGAQEATEREAYAETLLPALQFGWSPLRALRAGGWKYVAAPEEELYELAADPREKTNLAASRPKVVAELRARLEQAAKRVSERAESSGAGSGGAEAARLDGEMRRQLESLGYIGGHARIDDHAAPAGPDPKQMAHLLEPLESGVAAFESGRMEEAGAKLGVVLESDPGNVFARRLLARSLLSRGRAEQGRAEYLRLLELAPGDAEALNTLGTLALRAGRYPEAEEKLRAAAEASPWDPRIRGNLAYLHARRGEYAAAEAMLVEVLKEHPRFVEAALNLAGLRRKLGRLPEAERALRDLLREVPNEPSALRALAGLLREQGRSAEATRLLQGNSP